ncbi:fibronectin type III domain-containing protein [Leifsonia sp. fls2-241-R2A-40a]|uniref:fibronectin type III domain-containing protein n=1 Tax=Leifsonia sp. fls2-241-R2A-40a TaxID=3040290 RepID=UPI002551B583|nr:fibronectin type III domain-containing protein [Leifsonia sp. fls2-241-R2A-40a]
MRRTAHTAAIAAVVGALSLIATALTATSAQAGTVPPVLSIKFGVDQSSQPAFQFGDNGAAKLYYGTLSRGISVGTSAVSVTVTPPPGQPLRMGDYAVVNGNQSDSAQPQVRLDAGGSTSGFTGELDIRDLQWNSIGQLYTFDLVLQGIGEVSMNEPHPGGVDLGARTLAFPATPIGFSSVPAQQAEWVHNTTSSTISLGAPAFAGTGAADFTASHSTCGSSLAAGATCSWKVGFSPKTAGPRTATMHIAVGGSTQSVALTGAAAIGTSSITTSGADPLDLGATNTYANGPYIVAESTFYGGYAWTAASTDASKNAQIVITPPGGGPASNGPPITSGVHTTAPWDGPVPTTQYGFQVTLDSHSCGAPMTGTIDVENLIVDALGLVEMAKITFSERCAGLPNSNPMTGTLLWQLRSDAVAPTAASGVTVGAGSTPTISWKPSASSDVAHTIARVSPGPASAVSILGGIPLSDGSATSATSPKLTAGQYTAAVWAVDTSGNVSAPATSTFTVGTPQTPYTVPSPPTSVSAVSTDGGGVISFSPPASDGNLPITQYEIRNGNTGATTLVPSTARSATVTGLPNGFHFQYTVRAINAAGYGTQADVVVSPVASTTPPPPPPPTPTQLLPDPGFESGAGGWKAFVTGTLATVASPVHGGVSALRVTAPTASPGLVGLTQNTVVANSAAGTVYTASCWVRPSASGLNIRAEFLEYTQNFSSDVHLPSTSIASLPAGTWTKVTWAGTAQRSGERMVPQIYSTNQTSATGSIVYDDCSVVAG